jgi:hypothetical protein
MVVNRLQKDLISSRIVLSASRLNCQNIFSQMGTHFFLVILIEISILKTTLYQKYTFTFLPKIQKKKQSKKKTVIIVYAQTALHFAAYLRNPICYDLSSVFPSNLIWLLHCNAMHFDSFLLSARHLFQKLVLFFCEIILVIHCCFQNKNLYQNYLKKSMCWKKNISRYF